MSNGSQPIVVAIDGPSASGKSTVSRNVARELGFIYVDSGALYRGMTWKALHDGIDVKDSEKVAFLAQTCQWDFLIEDRVVQFTLDGENPWEQLRSEAVRENVSDIAASAEVRVLIGRHLRRMAAFGPLVMEGRDIGSVVFLDAAYKFYLDADPAERARRRHQELVSQEGKGDVNEVLRSLQRRDQKDTTRKTAPLQIALGAQVINTTSMTIDEVVQEIISIVQTQEANA